MSRNLDKQLKEREIIRQQIAFERGLKNIDFQTRLEMVFDYMKKIQGITPGSIEFES